MDNAIVVILLFLSKFHCHADTELPPNYRLDDRCGPDKPGPNGEEGICLLDGIKPCCSTNGWCGNTDNSCIYKLYYREFPPGRGVCMAVRTFVFVC